jgi:hypothetical protein
LSFGRGEPVTLLGGGALLWNPGVQVDVGAIDGTLRTASPSTAICFCGYNLLRQPWIYGLISTLAKLGETRYKTLDGVPSLDPFRALRLTSNIRAQAFDPSGLIAQYQGFISNQANLDSLPGIESTRFPARYPVLVKNLELRDRALRVIQAYGASAMYKRPLPGIAGIPRESIVDRLDYPNASDFADRLLTLPLHSNVRDQDVREIFTRLRRTCI